MPRPSVKCLFAPGRPAAVGWRITTIVVAAIKGVRQTRSPAHISKKIDIIIPSLTDLNATAAPILIAGAVGVIATRAHCLPRAVFWRASVFSMLSFGYLIVFFGNFLVETSARFGVPLFQIAGIDDALIPAVTETKPPRVCVENVHKGHSDQAAKALTCNVCRRHCVVTLIGGGAHVYPV